MKLVTVESNARFALPTATGNTSRKRSLSFAEAKASPCENCSGAPCCRVLPVHTFRIGNLSDLDQAIYFLNFDQIELGLSCDGTWSIFYVQECTFLDSNSRCSIYNQPERPHICRQYNPYNCWYRFALGEGTDAFYARIDRGRLQWLAGLLRFDDNRVLQEFPPWEIISDGLSRFPLSENLVTVSRMPSSARSKKAGPERPLPTEFSKTDRSSDRQEFDLPCRECSSHCCKNLIFPKTIPEDFGQLDFFRFSLGFPGVELGLSPNSWLLIIKTACRHLDHDKCGVFGKPERPILCSYYNAWSCAFKPLFAPTSLNGVVRVGLKEYSRVMELFQFDADGKITSAPLLKTIRSYLERPAF